MLSKSIVHFPISPRFSELGIGKAIKRFVGPLDSQASKISSQCRLRWANSNRKWNHLPALLATRISERDIVCALHLNGILQRLSSLRDAESGASIRPALHTGRLIADGRFSISTFSRFYAIK